MSPLRIALLSIAILALGLASALPVIVSHLRRQTGFTVDRDARVTASDVGIAWIATIRDSARGLVGKPDYVIELDVGGARRLVPVEVKPTRRSNRLYESDRLQLGIYLLAMRDSAGRRAAPFGYVRYASQSFTVELTPDLESAIDRAVERIRAGRRLPVVHRDHSSIARCRACTVRAHCDESLAD